MKACKISVAILNFVDMKLTINVKWHIATFERNAEDSTNSLN